MTTIEVNCNKHGRKWRIADFSRDAALLCVLQSQTPGGA
jgi:hypothetical protein